MATHEEPTPTGAPQQPAAALATDDNPMLALAERYVNCTDTSLFLTGKAGTGKTTFLHHIAATTGKRCVVVAPTGVAAVNAGGVTIHSFFQLPFDPYLPDVPELRTEYQMPERNKQLRKSKQKIIRTLDLLIIDEISMVRADLLDAVDAVLRRYRRSDRPFGGVQLLMIGDVQQLSPVVTEREAPYLAKVYSSPFFFHAKALQRLRYVTLQLQKIYRQQDATFIHLLNDVRDGHLNEATLQLLNSRLLPHFQPQQGEDYIRLTSHNSQAESFNQQKMKQLNAKEYTFQAVVEGTFPTGNMPTDALLRLKVGAQVMFVKNDSTGQHRYYNGKIGIIEAIDPDEGISVTDNEENHIQVSRDKWENFTYDLDPTDNQIKQKVEGSFTQYPLKAAWAVTIHKAQGLTFDHVIIDAQGAFAYGQVYVALSRCRTLQGLVLSTPITARNIFDSQDIDQFNASFTPPAQLSDLLHESENDYYFDRLHELFDFAGVRDTVGAVNRLFRTNLQSVYPVQSHTAATLVQSDVPALLSVGAKFQNQLTNLRRQLPGGPTDAHLQERIRKGMAYFLEQVAEIEEAISPLLQVEVDSKEATQTQQDAATMCREQIGLKRHLLEQMHVDGFSVDGYNKARMDYLLSLEETAGKGSKKRSRSAAAAKKLSAEQVYGDVRHPALVELLVQWRAAQARDMGVENYMVLPQRILLAIANVLPLTIEALRSIPGMGPKKTQQYGMEIVQLVESYCQEQGIAREETQTLHFAIEGDTPPQEMKASAPQKKAPAATEEKLPSWQLSAALFREGNSVEQIAASRNLAPSTIEGHLIQALNAGEIALRLILTNEEEDTLVQYILDHGPFDKLTQIYEAFHGTYSFFKIRAAYYLASTLL